MPKQTEVFFFLFPGFVVFSEFYFGEMFQNSCNIRDAKLKRGLKRFKIPGRSPMFPFLTLKMLFEVEIFRLNLKNSSTIKKNCPKNTKKIGQNMSEKMHFMRLYLFVREIWWLVGESGRFGLYPMRCDFKAWYVPCGWMFKCLGWPCPATFIFCFSRHQSWHSGLLAPQNTWCGIAYFEAQVSSK